MVEKKSQFQIEKVRSNLLQYTHGSLKASEKLNLVRRYLLKRSPNFKSL